MILLREEPQAKIPIYIHEQDTELRNNMVAYIENFIETEQLEMRVVLATGDPVDLLETVRKKNRPGICILDSTYKHFLELANAIKMDYPRGFIMYTASPLELEALRGKVTNYIMKYDYRKIASWLIECFQKSKKVKKYLAIADGSKFRYEALKDILYITAALEPRRLLLSSRNRHIEFYGRLKEIEPQLNDHFIKISRSVIVNQDYIKSVDASKGIINLTNGEQLNIPKSL
ncbi:accessory gene regulator protein A [Listeria weihenstephanensis FSL R9-0317]|uniref:HTH LytTR-type domain-containing protein n=1 Tax=Listeria weihenstephanensis TaxID=1006155 RepID=A0A1S7FRP7_9LIST|nr:LytTR family DNA-binding domain-containing protein [Listeria weihenstephanensis]AQY50128.1 hypothetical protein UE46_03145 [Listeria weihenstephanensis]EUJ36612.1 accessory gene regulator protein A [Listeria weihenstephanensis FSL R9-0317]